MWHFVTCFPLFKTQVQGWPQDGYQCAPEPNDVDEIRTWNSAPSKGLCDSGLFFTFWQRILSTCSEILTPSLVHKWMIINDHRIPKVIPWRIMKSDEQSWHGIMTILNQCHRLRRLARAPQGTPGTPRRGSSARGRAAGAGCSPSEGVMEQWLMDTAGYGCLMMIYDD